MHGRLEMGTQTGTPVFHKTFETFKHRNAHDDHFWYGGLCHLRRTCTSTLAMTHRIATETWLISHEFKTVISQVVHQIFRKTNLWYVIHDII
jgi:hypothetical protein